MPWDWIGPFDGIDTKRKRAERIGRPDRGNRAKVKAGRKAARRLR